MPSGRRSGPRRAVERGFGGRDAEAGARGATCWRSSATAAAYYARARIGLELAYPHAGTSTYGSLTAFWPPVGLGIAALVLYGPRLWPAIVIGDLLARRLLDAARRDARPDARHRASRSSWRPSCSSAWARARPGLRVSDVLILIVCAAAGTALGAGLGVLAIWIAGDLPAVGVGQHLAHVVAVRPRRRARRHSRAADVGDRARASDDGSEASRARR